MLLPFLYQLFDHIRYSDQPDFRMDWCCMTTVVAVASNRTIDQSDFRTHYVLYKIVILLISRHTDQALLRLLTSLLTKCILNGKYHYSFASWAL